MKKQIAKPTLLAALTLALLASAVMTAAAEEVVGKIMFEPTRGITPAGPFYTYNLDTNNDGIVDRRMTISYGRDGRSITDTLTMYLNKEYEVIFEDRGLPPAPNQTAFWGERMIAFIMPNGQRVELTQLFSRDVITRNFLYLNQKLRAQGL